MDNQHILVIILLVQDTRLYTVHIYILKKHFHTWTDGKKYEGDWLNGEKNGQGITMLPNGEKHDGLYVANR